MFAHIYRDGAMKSFFAAHQRGEYPMSAVVEGGEYADVRFQTPPALHLSDLQKLRRLSEPQRASKWVTMCLVASDGSFVDFEATYKGYYRRFNPDPPDNFSEKCEQGQKMQASGDHEQSDEDPQDEEAEEAHPAEDSDEKKSSGEQPIEKQPMTTEHLPETKRRDQCSKDILAPPVTRSDFFQVLCDKVHGIKIYSRKGRVHSWSDKDFNQGMRFLILGISTRLEALTFPSTSREQNLDQLQRYKKEGKLVFPEGDPEKRSTFSKKLADDPLFMLPKEIQSPWMKRKLKDPAYYDGKSTEDSGFPGVSLNANHASKELKAANVDRPKRSAESSRVSARPELIQNVEARSDQKQLPPKGKGKQRQECREPAVDYQATVTSLSDQRSSVPVTATGLKRKRSYSDFRRVTQTPVGIQATSSKSRGNGGRATETDAKGRRQSWCPVHG